MLSIKKIYGSFLLLFSLVPFVSNACIDAKKASIALLQLSEIATDSKSKKKRSLLACPHCDKHFSNNAYMTKHMRVHSGEKPFACHCGIAFAQKCNLTVHQRIHTGDRPYHCTECPKTFNRKSCLTLHLEIHNPQNFACQRCNHIFKTSRSLKQHTSIACLNMNIKKTKIPAFIPLDPEMPTLIPLNHDQDSTMHNYLEAAADDHSDQLSDYDRFLLDQEISPSLTHTFLPDVPLLHAYDAMDEVSDIHTPHIFYFPEDNPYQPKTHKRFDTLFLVTPQPANQLLEDLF